MTFGTMEVWLRSELEDRGSALIWALLFVVVTSGMVVSHTTFLAARRGDRDARYTRASMAETFVRSGLQDAVGWFHRSSNQPITTFDPVYDPSGVPPRIDTIDPVIGLVREFEINGNLFGRYEVRREETHDISTQRGELPPGSVWELGIRAYVYRKRDPSRAFDESPNQLVGTSALKSEVRWLQINPPAPAAVCVEDPSKVRIGRYASLDGSGSSALAYRDPATTTEVSGTASIDDQADIQGAPSQLASPMFDSSPERVFAMRMDELRGYSDLFVSDNERISFWQALAQWWADRKSASGDSSPNDAATTASTNVVRGQLLYTEGLDLSGDLTIQDSLLVVDGDLTDSLGHNTSDRWRRVCDWRRCDRQRQSRDQRSADRAWRRSPRHALGRVFEEG